MMRLMEVLAAFGTKPGAARNTGGRILKKKKNFGEKEYVWTRKGSEKNGKTVFHSVADTAVDNHGDKH